MRNDAQGEFKAADEVLVDAIEDQDDQAQQIDPTGNALWSYQHEYRINGVPVAERDRELKIDRDDMLAAAFVLHRRPRSELMWLAPGDGDKGSARYSELLELAADGRLEIVDELRQWDAAGGRFALWIRYDELEYRLHPRFDFLREE